ncbi:MAG: alpha/beta hydrolase [Bacteroidales bacterium]|nr:alpha/beta hydrolase [Bacteroidales bacterium]
MIIHINDIDLHVETCGQGEALILLHGNGESLQVFQRQTAYFSKFFRVVAIDTRAHGLSQRGAAPLDFWTFARDTVAVMDCLGLRQAHLFGFSDGGNTALHVALTAPERVLSLVLAGANLFPEGMKNRVLFSIKASHVWLQILSPLCKKMRQKKEVWALMLKHPHLDFEQISNIHHPVLVMAGEYDMIRTEHTRSIAQAIPRATLATVAGANHFMLFEKPDESNRIVHDFYRGKCTESSHFPNNNNR